MAAILPDEIKDISQLSDNEKLNAMYEYIKYMHEQLEFWSSNLTKQLLVIDDNFKLMQDEIDGIIEYLEKENE